MPIWDKLRTELDRAGRVAQGALDEGKLRLEIFRARQLVDRAAQSLGYAVYRDRVGRETADERALSRLTDAMRERELELTLLEDRMREMTGRSVPHDDVPPGADAATGPGVDAKPAGSAAAPAGPVADPPTPSRADEPAPPTS